MRLIMGQKRQKCQKRQTGKNKPNTFAPPSVSAASAVPDVSDIRDISDFADLRRATPENRKALEQFLMTHCTEKDKNGKTQLKSPSADQIPGILALIPGLPGFGMSAIPVNPGVPGFLDSSTDSDVTISPTVSEVPDLVSPVPNGSDVPNGSAVPNGSEVPKGSDVPNGSDTPNGPTIPDGAYVIKGPRVPGVHEIPKGEKSLKAQMSHVDNVSEDDEDEKLKEQFQFLKDMEEKLDEQKKKLEHMDKFLGTSNPKTKKQEYMEMDIETWKKKNLYLEKKTEYLRVQTEFLVKQQDFQTKQIEFLQKQSKFLQKQNNMVKKQSENLDQSRQTNALAQKALSDIMIHCVEAFEFFKKHHNDGRQPDAQAQVTEVAFKVVENIDKIAAMVGNPRFPRT